MGSDIRQGNPEPLEQHFPRYLEEYRDYIRILQIQIRPGHGYALNYRHVSSYDRINGRFLILELYDRTIRQMLQDDSAGIQKQAEGIISSLIDQAGDFLTLSFLTKRIKLIIAVIVVILINNRLALKRSRSANRRMAVLLPNILNSVPAYRLLWIIWINAAG